MRRVDLDFHRGFDLSCQILGIIFTWKKLVILGPLDRDATMGGKLVFLAGLLSLTALRTARGTYTACLLLRRINRMGARVQRMD